MELLLFRHGPAGDRDKWKARGLPDAERPLTALGKEKTEKSAAGLTAVMPRLDLIAFSSLKRASQTADILRRRYKAAGTLELPQLEPTATPEAMLAKLRTMAEARRVALVGHEPHLGSLASLLIGGKGARLELKKAGACLLDVDALQAGGARLLWLLQPSHLRALR